MKYSEKKYEKYWYAGVTVFGVIVAAVILYAIVNNLSGLASMFVAVNSALVPVYIGIVVAYLLSPLVDKMDEYIYIPLWEKVYKRKKRKAACVARGCSVFTSLVLFLLLVIGLFMLVVPEIIDSVSNLISNLPGYYQNVIEWGNHMFRSNPKFAEYYTQFSGTIYEKLLTWLQNDLLPNSNKLLTAVTDGVFSVASIVMNLFIGLIVSIYLMVSKERFCAQGKKIMYAVLPAKKVSFALDVFGETHTIFAKFISGKLIDSLLVGVLTFIVMSIAGIPYTLLISVLIGATNIIPFFGQYIGIIPSAFLVFIANPSQGLLFLILIIVLMQFDGNVLGPKILGDSIGLSSFWILFSILFFGSLFGLLGMICAVPIFAVLYRIAKRWCAASLAKKNMPTETEYYLEKKNGIK